MNRAFVGAYNKGKEAATRGEPITACPYVADGTDTYSPAFARYWTKGYRFGAAELERGWTDSAERRADLLMAALERANADRERLAVENDGQQGDDLGARTGLDRLVTANREIARRLRARRATPKRRPSHPKGAR